MHEKLLMLLSLTEVMFLGVFLWVLPRIGRHGLLFGVYVGEEGSSGERAKEIVRLWNRRIAATIAAAAGLAILAGVSLTPLWAYPVGPCLLLIGSIAAYLSAHTRSRALAS